MENLLLLVAATYYWTTVLTNESISGPFGVFRRLREAKIGQHSLHGGVLDCNICTAIWVALLIYALREGGSLGIWLLWASAAAGLYVFIASLQSSLDDWVQARTTWLYTDVARKTASRSEKVDE